MSIVYIIQPGYTNLHLYSLIVLYKNAIKERYLQLLSSTKYYPNANNSNQKLFLNKFQANLSSIFKYLFINVYFVKCDDLVISVENPKKWVSLFTGHPVSRWGLGCRAEKSAEAFEEQKFMGYVFLRYLVIYG